MVRNAMRSRGCDVFRLGSKTTGLWPNGRNPDSHPSSVWAVKSEVYQAEATGIGSASSICPGGRCRIPFPDLRTEPAPRRPSPHDTDSHPRYRDRARKLGVGQETAIRALAATSSLRSLAMKFGLSHETIRAVVRQDREAAG